MPHLPMQEIREEIVMAKRMKCADPEPHKAHKWYTPDKGTDTILIEYWCPGVEAENT